MTTKVSESGASLFRGLQSGLAPNILARGLQFKVFGAAQYWCN